MEEENSCKEGEGRRQNFQKHGSEGNRTFHFKHGWDSDNPVRVTRGRERGTGSLRIKRETIS